MSNARPRLCMVTIGCKANQCDSAAMLGYLSEKYEIVGAGPDAAAEVYVINTCTVTHKADFDARQWVRRIRRRNPAAKIIATGCMAETGRESLAREKVDAIFGVSERERLVEELTGQRPGAGPGIFHHPSAGLQLRGRAMLKIQEGCDHRCSYCIVPYARGRSRSMEPSRVLQQLSSLAGQGFEEVVLCGINLAEWGRDIGAELADLIREIEGEKIPARIRLSSLEPMGITEKLVNAIASSQIVCPHLHLPLQSGDDQLLKRMKRPYSAQKILELCGRLLAEIPGLCLGLDVITGFPGEGPAQFENTISLLEKIPFGYLHVFTFSPRAGTPGQKLEPRVPERVSRERARRLARLSRRRQREFAASQLGQTMEMVVEGREGDWSYGHSGNYLYLKVRTESPVRKRIRVQLKIADKELIAEEIA